MRPKRSVVSDCIESRLLQLTYFPIKRFFYCYFLTHFRYFYKRLKHYYMKAVIFLFALCTSLLVNAQKNYIMDEHVSVDGDPGNQRIVDYTTEKVLCKKVPADDIVTATLHGLMGFRKGNKYGLMNIYGKIIVPAQFDDYALGEGSYPIEIDGDYFIVRKGETIGLIDSTGKFALPLGDYDYVWDVGRGLTAAQKGMSIGLYKLGKPLFPMGEYEFPQATKFEEEITLMIIQKGDLYGLMNDQGTIVQPVKYSEVIFLSPQYCTLKLDSLEYLVDASGKICSKEGYSNIITVENDWIYASKGWKQGIVKIDGTVICPFEFDQITRNVVNNTFFVQHNYKWGLFHVDAPQNISFDYENSYGPTWQWNGVAWVLQNGLWGLINTKGEFLCKPQFTNAGVPNFSNDFASVEINRKHGIIDIKGNIILPCEYDYVISSYGKQSVKKNGRTGYLSEKYEVLVPCEFDEIVHNLYDDRYAVRLNGKIGIYQTNVGLIAPTIYDDVQYVDDYYLKKNYISTTQNQKTGFLNLEGKTIIPPVIDVIYQTKKETILVREKDTLKHYSLETGEQLPLETDSTITFESTRFIKIDNFWFCLQKNSNTIIGAVYNSLYAFNERGNAIAQPFDSDYAMAINTKGEDLRPRFHPETQRLLSDNIPTDTEEAIDERLIKEGLISASSSTPIKKQKEDKLIIQVYQYPMYDEWGNETDSMVTVLECFDKLSYFDEQTPFPAQPYYAFNYAQFYSNYSAPNQQGWRWANKRGDYPIEDRASFICEHTVLINDKGEEISKQNYMPVSSIPFFTHTFNSEGKMVFENGILSWEMNEPLPWDSLGKYTEVMDSLKSHFPSAKNLTIPQFIDRYEDSLYSTNMTYYTYIPDYEEVPTYEYHFYKRSGLQLFNVPPPTNVKYRFVMDNPNKIIGGENLPNYKVEEKYTLNEMEYQRTSDIPFLQMIKLGDQTAYVFGEMGYFTYPVQTPYGGAKEKQEIAAKFSSGSSPKSVQNDLKRFDYFTKLIETGLAKPWDNYTRDENRDKFILEHGDSLRSYAYPKNLGLAFENELLIPIRYLAIAPDKSAMGKKGISEYVVIDSLLNVWRYDLENKQLIIDKNVTFVGITQSEIITQHIKSKFYAVNSMGGRLEYKFDEPYKAWRTVPSAKDFEQLLFVGNCNYSEIPLANSDGEDSMIVLEDGTYQFVYYHGCDTNVLGKYGRFINGLDIYAYKRFNQVGTTIAMEGISEPFEITQTSLVNYLPLNVSGDRYFTVQEETDGILFSMEGRYLKVPLKQYLQVRDQNSSENGYGGVFQKGEYIPYCTLLPFPEKYKVYINLYKQNFLVGDQMKLELVKLDENKHLVKSGLFFNSQEDFMDVYRNDFDVRPSINEFIGYGMW